MGSTASMGPVLFSAFLSTLAWNFLFIPPRFTFVINEAEDILLCFTYFVAAIITGVLTNRVRQADILRESEKLHQTLLNSISHELRTPLTTIMGAATALGDPNAPDSPTFRNAISVELSFASDRLNRVIENLLDMNRIHSGVITLKREWHDIHDLVGVALQRLGKNLENHHVKVDISTDVPLIEMDFRLMEHVLSNILLNATQYSSAGADIDITCKTDRQSVRICVENGGSEIADDQLSKIFDKFYRIPGTPSGGVGLGLSIAKNIVELHKGAILAENVVDQSVENRVRFSITLPLGKAPGVPVE